MAFRRRSRQSQSIRPVNRIKHVVDVQAGVGLGVQLNTIIVNSVDNPVIANSNAVRTGSVVNGIYLRVEINATSSAALANAYMIIFKSPNGSIAVPAANTVGVNVNKKYVIHQEMVMLQQQTNSNPRTLFNGVIAIPRHMRRMAPNDQLLVGILSPGVNLNLCIQCHYKEFF